MNAVGNIGQFIIKYQTAIQVVLIAAAVFAAVFFLIKAVCDAKKKRQILSRISDTVTEINSAVSSLSEKKSDVIYIDNRTSERPQTEQVSSDCRKKDSAVKRAEAISEETDNACSSPTLHSDEPGLKLQKDAQAEGEQLAEAKTEREMNACEEIQLPKKYFERDCSISKNGKTYTIEELERQIR